MKRAITYLLLSLLGLSFSLAQSTVKKLNKVEKSQYLDADSYYAFGDYLTATKLFEPLLQKHPDIAELNFKQGDALVQLKRLSAAIPYLENGVGYNADAYYLLALAQLHESKLAKAAEALNAFQEKFDAKTSNLKIEDQERLKNQIQTAKRMMQTPEDLNIYNLGNQVNSEFDEYVPLIASDEATLIFTSRRMHANNSLDPTGRPFEDVYFSAQENGVWSAAQLIEGSVNTEKHDASVGLSPDGNRLYLFRTNDNLIGGDLYESTKKGDAWTQPIILPQQINGAYSIEPSASISLDERTFYFSSNREGGEGGFDIYRVVKLPNNLWSLPLNLGPQINTAMDEDAPFIHPDGKSLYFSSKGHENMGGFDVFKSTLQENGEWSKPQNLGYPTNTTQDDIYFVIAANEQRAYIASDRTGGLGGQDIYQIEYLEKQLRQSVIRGKVVDATTGKPVAADVSLVELESGDLSGVYLADAKDGEFIFLVNPNVDYDVEIIAEGYEDQYEEVNYSVNDLMQPQSITYQISKNSSAP